MRILVVQESNWLEKGPHQSHHLMERLAKRGHRVRVIDFDILWRSKDDGKILARRMIFDGVHKATEDADVTVIRPSILKLPILEYLSLAYFHRKEVLRQIREYKPNVIVGFGLLNAFISIQEARKEGIPFVYYVIDELHRLVPQRTLRPFARVLEQFNMASATRVVTINEGLRDYAIRMRSRRENTSVIRAGVDLKKFARNDSARDSIRKRYGFVDEDTVLFFMGWLYDFSGLIEVANELSRPEWKDLNLKLLVVGEGPLWEKLRELKEELLQTNRLTLVQWQPYHEIPGYILASDICILPAHDNQIMRNIVPIKMYEYMAAGKPVIATRLPGLEKEFNEGSGIVCVNRPEETVRAAMTILTSNQLPALQAAARDTVKWNDWEKTTSAFEQLLRRQIDPLEPSNG